MTVIVNSQEQFLIDHTNSKALKYIGLNMVQKSDRSITLNQNGIAILREITINNVYAIHGSEDVTDNKKSYRALVSQLNWVAIQTRPDVSHDVCKVNSVFDTP